MKSRLIYTAIALFSFSLASSAQSIDILGFTSGMRSSQVKAKVNLGSKTLSGVTAYSYRMTDGAHSDSNVYSIVDAGDGSFYLSANVDLWSGAYDFFQLRLDFTDGTHYTSECVNPDFSQAFYWLGDVPMSKAKSGWDSAHPPVVDGSVDPGYKITLDDIIYYKGVSNHAEGEMEFSLSEFPLPKKYKEAGGFKKFNTLVGVQDDKPNGSVEFVFRADDSERARKQMYSKTNTARNGAPCVESVEFDVDGVRLLNIKALLLDGLNWGDHAQHALARLYLARPDRAAKTVPTLTFSQETDSLKEAVSLSASLSEAAGNVYYSIVSGLDCATLSGSTLTPVWGKKGEVVVEATYYGDDSHQPVSSYATYYVDLAPSVEILELYQSADASLPHRGYLLVDTKGADISKLNLTVYDNHDELNQQATLNLTDKVRQGVLGPQIVTFDIENAGANPVLVLSYQYAGQQEVTTPYWEAGEYFDYMSDLPFTSQVGWGVIRKNEAYRDDNAASSPLVIGNEPTQYKKGFGLHAAGYVESQADLSKYHRFAMHIGGQKISNTTRDANITFGLQNGATALVPDVTVPWTTRLDWDTPVNHGENIRLRINIKKADGGNNTNNIVAIAAPRLFYYPVIKPSQTLAWGPEKVIRINAPASYELDAEASSSLSPDYRVVEGQAYASISGNKLNITRLPEDGSVDIKVEAYQPGNAVWGAAPSVVQTYRLMRGLEVGRDEVVSIKTSQTLDEVIVHADRESSGQIRVEKGILNVKKLILKYTFVPGEWSYIAFPSSVDIRKISDFADKGFAFNNEFGPAYYIQTLTAGVNPSDAAGWVSLESPLVKGMKGYAMSIGNTASNEPVEITFTFDNVGLDMTEHVRPVGATLNLSAMSAGDKQIVTVTPEKVDGASLNVTVTYQPSDLSQQPLDFNRALNEARFTFSDNRRKLRLTLPDMTPARVVFFNENGNKVVKAVKYVSPQAIDVSNLKRGTYNVAVEYGNATRIFKVEI